MILNIYSFKKNSDGTYSIKTKQDLFVIPGYSVSILFFVFFWIVNV